MAQPNESETTIIFIAKEADKADTPPRWRRVQVKNAGCPMCGQIMAVWTGDNMYGFCPQCQSYYLAD